MANASHDRLAFCELSTKAVDNGTPAQLLYSPESDVSCVGHSPKHLVTAKDGLRLLSSHDVPSDSPDLIDRIG